MTDKPNPLTFMSTVNALQTLSLAEALAGVGHWQFDFESGDVSWSDEVYKIHGVSRETFDPSLDVVLSAYHPDDRPVLLAKISRARQFGEGYNLKLRIRRFSDQSERTVIAKAIVQQGENGAPAALFGVFQDLTDEEVLRRKTLEAEATFRLLAEAASDMLARCRIDGVMTYASPASEAILGYMPAEMIGHEALEFIHEDDRADVRRQLIAFMRLGHGAAPIRIEYRARHKDGSTRWLEANPRAIFGADGRVVEFRDVIRDITERKYVEEVAKAALIEAERAREDAAKNGALYRLLADQSMDVILKTAIGGEVLYCSPATRQFGYEPEDLIGTNFAGLIHPDDLPALIESTSSLYAGKVPGGTLKRQQRVRVNGGDYVWLESNAKLVLDENGAATGAITTLRDITTRKTSEEALATSETRYRLIADNASDMIATISPTNEITFVSPGCLHVLGWPAEALIGRRTLDLMHPDDVADVVSFYVELIGRGPGATSSPFQFRAKHRNGHWVWLEGQPKVFFDVETGGMTSMQDVVRDITYRKNMEIELETARIAAEAAVVVKSEFLSNMSHELRTPLTSILGFSAMLKDETGLTESAQRAVDRVAASSQALLMIVNDILDFSKLESGEVKLDCKPCDLHNLVKTSLDLLAPQAALKGLKLNYRHAGELPAWVSMDEGRVRQVLLNLLSNGVKFTAKGDVTLSTQYDAVHQRLRCEIIDTGLGIPADRLDRLFKRFSQVDASTTRSFGGTGLGLAICKGLVEAMGGEIGVDSIVGQGASFWFELPCPELEAAKADDDGASENDFADALDGLRVLVTDDNAMNREIVRLMLSVYGVEITDADCGATAVELAGSQPFDLILMDMRMPGMDGVTAARAIRSGAGPNDGVPILAFTADVLQLTNDKSGHSLFDDHIAKPIVPADLIFKVANWSRQETNLPNVSSRMNG